MPPAVAMRRLLINTHFGLIRRIFVRREVRLMIVNIRCNNFYACFAVLLSEVEIATTAN